MAEHKKKRIGILTGGGDAPGTNAVVRGAVLRAQAAGAMVVGIRRSWLGLVERDFVALDAAITRRWIVAGGTELRTRRHNPFEESTAEAVRAGYESANLDGLIAIGGDGTLSTCARFAEGGMPIVGVPKTIDNDIVGTDQTFGFDTAVQNACEAIDKLHTTAASHGRVLLVEVMGRNAGWIAAHAGIAGDADLILVPERPVRLQAILDWGASLKERGREYAILVVAEGAIVRRDDGSTLTRGELTAQGHEKLGGISQRIADELVAQGIDCRTTILGHVQRGGTPTAFDRLLSVRYGAHAVDLLLAGKVGTMVSLRHNRMTAIPLSEIAGKRRMLDPSEFESHWLLPALAEKI
ncbi:6-phosphofructokinase [Zavarzinia sp. CC-PAN008]|uniref:6-phosphofructokinase n=1 Tax=Zavarzinia sp. CC-PAN008 TaxID=3243332 RepID=UPI003F74A9A6